MRNLSNLYIDGVVGIGTTSPNSILDIRGASAYFHIGNTSDSRYVDIGHWASGRIQIEAGNGDLYLKTQTSNYLALGTANVERLRIDSSGNVGIGTTSPTTILHVKGPSSTGWAIFERGTKQLYVNANYSGLDVFAQVAPASASAMDMSIAATDLRPSDIYIKNASGNVGIGTTSPAGKIDVKGTILWGADAQGRLTYSTTDAYIDALKTGGDIYIRTNGTATDAMAILSDGNVGIGTTSPDAKLHVNDAGTLNSQTIVLGLSSTSLRPMIQFSENATAGLLSGMSIEYDGRNSGVNNRMHINGVDNAPKVTIMSGGNVGIGTTSPAEKLHVSGKILQNNGGSLYIDANATNTILASVGARDVLFEVNSANRLIIGSTGTIRLNNYGSGSKTGTVAYNLAVDSSGNVIETAGGVVDGSGTANYVSKWSDANTLTNSLLYDNGSTISIGLGSTTPSYTNAYGYPQFAIESNAFASSHVFTHNNTNGNYSFFALGKSKGTAAAPTIVENSETIGDFQFWAYDGAAYRNTAFIRNQIDGEPGAGDVPGRLVFGTTNDGSSAASEKMRITSAGNVGIGTSSPAQKLDVSQGSIFLSGSGSKYLYIRRHDGLGTHSFGVGSDEKLILSLSGSNPFIVDGGNVLIGTTTDSGYKLDVIGSTKIGGPLTIRQGATDQNTSSDSATIPSTTGAEFLRIEGNYTNGQYTHELAKIDRGGNLPLYIRESKVTANSFSNIARFGSHSYSSYEFEVFGDINATGNITGANLNISNWNTAYGWGNHASAGYLTSEADTLATVTTRGNTTTNAITTGTHTIYGTNTTSAESVLIQFTASGDTLGSIRTYNAGAYNQHTRFYTSNVTGTTETLAFMYDHNGNVGIGTTSPDQKLHVHKGSAGVVSSNGNTIITAENSTNGYIQLLVPDANESGILFGRPTFDADGGILYNSNVSRGLEFRTGGNSTKMVITSAGNVGIGTTSPSKKLHVIGDAWINRPSNKVDNNGATEFGSRVEFNNSFVSGQSGYMVFRYPTYNNFLIGGDYDGNIGGGIPNIQFGRSNGTVYVHIDANGGTGNVGIGTTSPTTKLDVNGVITATGGDSTNWNTAYGWGNHAGLYDNYGSWNLKTNGTQRTTVQSGGTLDIVAGTNVSVSYGAGGVVTINSTDTNTTYTAGTGLTLSGTQFSVTSGTYAAASHEHTYIRNVAATQAADACMPSTGYALQHFLGQGPSGNDGHILGMTWSTASAYGAQLWIDTDPNNLMAFRSRSSTGVWTGWNNVYHSGNLTLATLGYTGDTNANYITNNNQLTNGAGYITSSALSGYATQTYVNTAISNLVDSAPGTLDTLNELAAALGDDPNFATTVTNSIATKLPFATYSTGTDVNTIARTSFGAINTGITSANRHQNYAAIYSLGVNGITNTLQIGTASDYNASGMWIRQYNTNASSPQGVGWQNWAQVWTSNNFANNSSNWDTAYSWGDHGTAGYATTTQLADYLPLTGGTIAGALTISGNLVVNGTITENSSIKIKENVVEIGGSLEKVNNLRPVSYNKIGSQNTELGLIAEEVQNTYPEFVQYDENGEPVGVNYSRLTVALIGAVQELTKRIEQLENNG